MRLNIQSLRFDASPALVSIVQEKTHRFPRYFDHITDCQVTLKLNRTRSGGSRAVEVKLLVPQSIIVATEEAATFEEALDLCMDSAIRQLTRYKEKLRQPSLKQLSQQRTPPLVEA